MQRQTVQVEDDADERAEPGEPDLTAVELGPWRLIRELGGGGMGTVWLAERADGAFRKNAAVKLIKPDVVGDEGIKRFLRERQILADLEHAHICRLLDGGTSPDGRPYLVMEWVEGKPLDEFCKCNDLSTEQLLRLFIKICGALAYAHARGVIHRDLKPSNVMVTGAGEPKLLDFGIARLHKSPDQSLTHTGQMVLTPSYASPEQWNGQKIGPASDTFSLGVILFELLTGWLPPMPGLHGVPPTVVVKGALPEPLQALILRAVHENPGERFATADALADALRDQLDIEEGRASSLDAAGSSDAPDRADLQHGTTHPQVAPAELPGDTVKPDSPYYVVRPRVEDLCLREVGKPGALIRIKGARQMGKTSLLRRILAHADQSGARTVMINLQLTDKAILGDLDRFLRWLCAVVSRKLKLSTAQLDDEWDDLFGSKDNCTAYFEETILPEAESLVIALDNLDCVFEAPSTAEEFLSLLRAWTEMGKSQEPWPRLRLVLSYATDMYLPMNINRSPFNVGLPVALSEWDADVVTDLARRHGLNLSQEDIDRVMTALSGHPHLIRVALYHIATGTSLTDVLDSAATDEGLFADHLKYLLWHLQAHPELGAAAARVMVAAKPVRLSTELAFKLASLGLVHLQGNEVRPARELYRRYLRDRQLGA